MRTVVGSIAFAFVVVLGSGTASAEDAKAPKSAAPAAAPAPAPQRTAPKRAASRSDVAVGAALARCDDVVAMQGPGPAASPTAPAASSILVAPEGRGLADIHVAGTRAADGAGTAREVALVSAEPAFKVARPVATARMQRKMSVDRAMASLTPALDACRALAGPAANGTVAVQLDVNATGQVERADVASVKGPMAKPAIACVTAAFASVRFGAPGPQGATLTVPVAVVQDHGDVTRVATSD